MISQPILNRQSLFIFVKTPIFQRETKRNETTTKKNKQKKKTNKKQKKKEKGSGWGGWEFGSLLYCPFWWFNYVFPVVIQIVSSMVGQVDLIGLFNVKSNLCLIDSPSKDIPSPNREHFSITFEGKGRTSEIGVIAIDPSVLSHTFSVSL